MGSVLIGDVGILNVSSIRQSVMATAVVISDQPRIDVMIIVDVFTDAI